MAVLIRAFVDHTTGKAALRFPYEVATKERVKEYGARWDGAAKTWTVPSTLLPVMMADGLVIHVSESGLRTAAIPEVILRRLRDYQVEAANFLIARRGAILSMEMRVGKTPPLIAAACALMGAGFADACLSIYPAGVLGTWEDQLLDWANAKLHYLETGVPFDDAEIWALKTQPYLFLGCHYDILGKRGLDLHKVLAGRRYIVIADEGQWLQNRKLDRTKMAFSLSHGLEAHAKWYSKSETEVIIRGPFDIVSPETGEVFQVPEGIPVASWAATGTPQRNMPRNLWGVMHFALQGCAGSYHKFTERYCDGKTDDLGFWDDSGESNAEELRLRLAAMSYRKLRRDVAQHLPATDYNVIRCSLNNEQLKKYKKLEKFFAPQAASALKGGEGVNAEAGLRTLVNATSEIKIPVAVERAREHTNRGVKVLCAAHFHETLQKLDQAFDIDAQGYVDERTPCAPHFCAGGWKTPAKRREIIDQWKACPGPAILLINSLSSGTGIDLADAEVMELLEPEWVPSDLSQLISRLQDIHLGKRKTPPIVDVLLASGTVDEAMIRVLLTKMKSIEAVVGGDTESGAIASTLRGAGVVQNGALGLADNSRETVLAALRSIHERWGDITGEAVSEGGANNAGLAGDFADHWEDEADEPKADEEDVPF